MSHPLSITLFETLLLESKTDTLALSDRIPMINAHLRRLKLSADQLTYLFNEQQYREYITAYIEPLDPQYSYRLRIDLHKDGRLIGQHNILAPLRESTKNIAIYPKALTTAPNQLWHKLSHRPWYQHAIDELLTQSELFDFIFFNQEGLLLEGTRSNVYVQNDYGEWLTPSIETGCLPGTYRHYLLQQGLVREAPIHYDDFMHAQAYRISNALRKWLPVSLRSDTLTLF